MVNVVLLQDCHSVGEANLHLQFTPKYRKPVFVDVVVRNAAEAAFKEVAKNLRVGLAGLGFGPDHVHLFVTGWKNYAPCELAKRFKGAVSRVLRKNCWPRVSTRLWGNAFWSAGYFYRTIGAVTTDAMQRYVNEAQQKHWKTMPAETQPTNNPITISQRPRGLQPTVVQKAPGALNIFNTIDNYLAMRCIWGNSSSFSATRLSSLDSFYPCSHDKKQCSKFKQKSKAVK